MVAVDSSRYGLGAPLAGVFVSLLGLMALGCYWFELPVPVVVAPIPGKHYATVLGTALFLFLSGSGITLRAMASGLRRGADALVMLALLIAVISLIERLSGLPLGAGMPALHAWYADSNVDVGLMSRDVALPLALFAVCYFLSNRELRGARAVWFRVILTAEFIAVLISIGSKIINMTSPLPDPAPMQMSPLSTLGLALLLIALYECRDGMSAERTVVALPLEARLRAAAMIIFCSAVGLATIASMLVLQIHYQEEIRTSLRARVAELADTAERDIEHLREDAHLLDTSSKSADWIRGTVQHSNAAAARQHLDEIARSNLGLHYSEIEFLDAQGTRLAGAGVERSSAIKMAMDETSHDALMWDEAFYLDVDSPIRSGTDPVGTLHTLQEIPYLTRLATRHTHDELGGEILVCTVQLERFTCFPTALPATDVAQADLRHPLSGAVPREKHQGQFVDYKLEPVLAAWQPIRATQLVVVVEVAMARLYHPMVSAYVSMLLVMCVLLCAGYGVFRMYLFPLIAAIAERQRNAQESELQMRRVIEAGSDALFILRCVRDARGEIEDFEFSFLSTHAEKLLARKNEDTVYQRLTHILPWARSNGWLDRYKRVIDTGRPVSTEMQMSFPGAPAGWMQMRSFALGDGLGVTVRDIGERKYAEERMRHMPQLDSLTQLPNRALFFDRLERAMTRTQRHGGMLALLYLDLDLFQDINEEYGHATGDNLLVAVAERLRKSVRAEDTVSRLDGDEFAIIIEGLHDQDESLRTAALVLGLLRRPFFLGAGPMEIAASVGIACYHGTKESSSELLQRADAALFEAKQQGRHRYHLAPDESPADGATSAG